MQFRPQNGIYQIDIPNEYEHEENEDILTIYNSNGVGAISITSYYIPTNYNFVIKDALLDFILSIDESLALNNIDLTNCETEYCNYEFLDSRGKYWRVWIYFANNYSAFVTYNCTNADKDVERNDVNNIVKSLVLGSRSL